MRKRDSRRRWKARCKAKRAIPAVAVVEHELQRWFALERVLDINCDCYMMVVVPVKPERPSYPTVLPVINNEA